MTGPREAAGAAESSAAGAPDATAAERVLRAKYLDWCSARVADRLFKLRPEEIYELAGALVVGEEPSGDFRAIVGRLTEEMTRQMGLPDFTQWRMLYEESPAPFDEDMIGFWRETPGS